MKEKYKVHLSDQVISEVERLADDASEEDLQGLKNAFEELAKNPFGKNSHRFRVGLDADGQKVLEEIVGETVVGYKFTLLNLENPTYPKNMVEVYTQEHFMLMVDVSEDFDISNGALKSIGDNGFKLVLTYTKGDEEKILECGQWVVIKRNNGQNRS